MAFATIKLKAMSSQFICSSTQSLVIWDYKKIIELDYKNVIIVDYKKSYIIIIVDYKKTNKIMLDYKKGKRDCCGLLERRSRT